MSAKVLFSIIRAEKADDNNGIMSNGVANPYLRDAVMTATPEQLQLMLYDGAIRFALQGRDAIEAKDYETSFDRLARTQNIIAEMLNGLNYDVNRELCERVASILNFLYRKLIDASVNKDVHAIDDALKVLRTERETWQILVDKVSQARRSPDVPEAAPSAGDDAPVRFSVEG